MTPNVDERLASVIRALTEVVLPHLPPEASLAQEQVHLAVGHLQILRAQIDSVPAYEREELDDAIAIGEAVHGGVSGGAATQAACTALAGTLAMAVPVDAPAARKRRQAIHDAIEALVRATAQDGDAVGKAALSQIILDMEGSRALKDRHWFAPFGFDTL